jgi:hypothetical protein
MPSGEGLVATAGPFTRSPRHRGAVVRRFAGWQYEPGRSPVRGKSPGREYPACTPFEGAFSSVQSVRIGRFRGDWTARPLAWRRPHHLPRRNVLGSAFAVRPSTRRVLHSGRARTATSRRFGSRLSVGPRPWAHRIGLGRSAASKHLGFRESPTEQLKKAAFSSVPRHVRAGFLLELGFRTVYLAASGSPRCRSTSVRESPQGGAVGGRLLRGTEAPRIGFTLPCGRPTTIGSAVVRDAIDALECNFTGERDRLGHVAVGAETLPTRCSHQVAPSGMPASGKPSSTLRLGRFPLHRTRMGSRLRRLAGHRGNPSNQAFQLLRALRFTEAPKRSRSPLCRRRSPPSPPLPRRIGAAVGTFPSGRAFKPPHVSDGHQCASARRIPTRRATFGPTVRALPAVPASAPKHLGGDSRSNKDHGASCRLAGPFSHAQRRVGFRLRRLRALSGPLGSKRRSAGTKRAIRRCRSVGPGVSWLPGHRSASNPGLAVGTDLAAVRVGVDRVAGKNPAPQSNRLRGPRVGLELCAAPQRRALPGTSSGRSPNGPYIPDSPQGMRRVR